MEKTRRTTHWGCPCIVWTRNGQFVRAEDQVGHPLRESEIQPVPINESGGWVRAA